MTTALVFPGQGSQSVGMGRTLYDSFDASRAVFDEVDEALGEKLSELIFEGPEDRLTLTENAQPALMAVSMAAIRALEAEGFSVETAAYVAGHSLGEYSALAAVGALSIGQTAKLLRIRGNAMQEAVPSGAGSMAAIIGLDAEAVAKLCEDAAEGEVCEPANDNGGGQIVISGNAAAIDRAIALAQERGAKRALPLSVSAPFHCRLMQPAADRMAEALADAEILVPRVPVVTNVTAAPTSDPAEIRERLVRQVTGQVRWRESIEWLAANGVNSLVEIGSGKVLTGLARRIDRSLEGRAIGTADDVRAFTAG
ncbi:malonyl Coenzyme A-acyl carrier protein transacylase [Aurantimonas manganoxydans SI85-9A1]|uniref:Malonyl CoA-acyl carrier protein transacylase n=2 Tax=Aurantimonas manganoxydans TaxID=651183 RepID=Q1YIE9_AURMS|nr:ACP S-malonyltransferase [Aurantimonas manganoxydans]EAS50168.1 malonyl Coenzyme A-acyl carrier protein transacylase [Aurantimonas manganoxydans SI85-9A1]MDX1731168.1 ACP S-malonyltransferase [Aurantimonas coralicida]BAT29396.1 malonyl CoA-acyl carrier protein transacylase [Aurantimonas manganoxydans SI85-9A1]